MKNLPNLIAQHRSAVAQVFSLYGIHKKPTIKTLSAAILVHKKAFLNDLKNILAQHGYAGDNFEGDNYEGENYEGEEGEDVYSDYNGRMVRGRRRHRKGFQQLLEEAKLKRLQADQLVAGTIALREPNGQVFAEVPQEQYETIPMMNPSIEELVERNHSFNGDSLDSVRGKEKKEKTYVKTGGFDVTKSRRSVGELMQTIGAVGKTAADLANAGIGVAANAKALKGGAPQPGGAGDGGDGGAQAAEPSKFKKYLPYIIGGAVLVVLVIVGFVLTKKK